MTADPSPPRPAGGDRAGSGLGRLLGRLRRVGLAERLRILTVGGRAIRVSVQQGAPGWPPLLLCNGIGVSLELFQPFVDALDPRRPVIRFDLPGIGGSPARSSPTTWPGCRHCWPACSTSSATPRPTSWASPGAAGSRSSSR